MRIFNTLTRKIDEFVPHDESEVKIYTCGPTVYSFQHVGNMRTYIYCDSLIKTLEYLGYNVKRVMNITDVGHLTSDADTGEDKMQLAAQRENKTVLDIAHYYTDQFFKDFTLLNNKMPDVVAPATDNIEEIIMIIGKLIDDGYAYISEGNVYFDTSKLKDYYVLTSHEKDELISGVRDTVTEDKAKRNKTDFVLWFTKSKFDDQELKWNSPWGLGYPGWHIECSAISIKYLGEYLDIHCGGIDLCFPHHTNEIAQSESYLGHKWCNYWLHPEYLNDETGKMSKSKGAKLTISLLKEQGYNPLAYRFMCLNSHYRNQLVFSYSSLDSANAAYKKLKAKTMSLSENGSFEQDKYDNYNDKFKSYIENDLNIANAISLLHELLKDKELNDTTKLKLVNDFDQVLSLDLLKKDEIDSSLLEYINEKIAERNTAKADKNYELADSIRKELLEKNIELLDTREKTIYKIKED